MVANAGINSGPENMDFEQPNANYAKGDDPPAPSLRVIDVNLIGVMYTTHLALWYLPRNPGSEPCSLISSLSETSRDRRLLLIGSIASLMPIVSQSIYGAAKHGVMGLFRSLRTTAPSTAGVRVNILCPYFIDTPLLDGPARAILAGAALGKTEDVVEAGRRFVADPGIIGRGLVVGPRIRVKSSKDESGVAEERFEIIKDGDGKESSIWECYAHDFEDSDVFARRALAMANAVAATRGWTGWAGDIVGAFTWPLRRWWSEASKEDDSL